MHAVRITLCISSLGLGGAQRVLLNLGGALVTHGHAVTIWTADPVTSDFFELPEGVERCRAELRDCFSCRWYEVRCQIRRTWEIRRSILSTKPDLVISFIDTTNIAVLLALVNSSVPIIVSERTYPCAHNIRARWALLRRLLYRRADRVVAVTRAAADCLDFLDPGKLAVIPNWVEGGRTMTGVIPRRRMVVAAGRLGVEKGFDLLIRAFAEVAEANRDWALEIYGEGGERDALQTLIEDLELSERVQLRGSVENLDAVFAEASVFALSSRYEGFPNALAEAMAAGMAVVSYDCQSGPSVLIDDGVDGLLVPAESVCELAKALGKLMADDALRQRLGRAAERVVAQFSKDAVLSEWEALLESVVTKPDRGVR